MKNLVLKIHWLGVVAVVLTGCALYSSNTFSAWYGQSEFMGTGGTKRTVDGIDIWTTGTPPQRYKIIGTIQQNSTTDSSVVSALAAMDSESSLIRDARRHGGDAIIYLADNSRVTGLDNFYAAYGSVTATRSNSKTIAIIKYL